MPYPRALSKHPVITIDPTIRIPEDSPKDNISILNKLDAPNNNKIKPKAVKKFPKVVTTYKKNLAFDLNLGILVVTFMLVFLIQPKS